ncbi:biopolymer transporter ExbD [Erythrobacter gaetbuli]|uniref:Biopolymer transporter ExbD n=1 Tax=Qipengyuania gaetbuli TaxID=266952 RepID=A0A844Y1Z0_9SPHN|nr:biopolymer transporter ExbD [Qipengyuania gaetbuli]MXO52024.1 biopolymer transporter ExbD [Qipengyuania gaetbuli]
MPYPSRTLAPAGRPMGDMNITPLIDVMLVLLIMFIMVIPIATHALQIPLPSGGATEEIRDVNVVTIDAQDRLYWNGAELDRQQLLNQLAAGADMPEEPLLRFEPHAFSSYEASARTIALIKDAGVTRFAFVGNEKYREFGSNVPN